MDKYAEAEGVIEQVVRIFTEKKDQQQAKDVANDVHNLKHTVEQKHKQVRRKHTHTNTQPRQLLKQLPHN